MGQDPRLSPVLFVTPESLEWGEPHGTAQELANAFQAPVYEPWWPDGAGPRRYWRRRPDSRRPYDTWAMLANLPDQTHPLIVRGIAAPLDDLTTEHDWQPVPELTTQHGHALTEPDGTLHVLVEKPGLTLQLSGFPSLTEATVLAQSMRRREPLEAPTMLYCITGGDDGEHFDNAQQLADALGRPVHEPAWPSSAGPPQYVLKRADFFRRTDTYTIFAEVRRGDYPLLVQGDPEPTCWRDGEQGWWAVPELGHVNGLEQCEGNSPHIVVEISGMTVHLSGYQSNADCITAALTLREYRPRTRG